MRVPTSKALIEANGLATRYLYVKPRGKKEVWHLTEPRDLPTMEIKFVRLADGTVWQVCARHRVKLHDSRNTELYPPPHGRGWAHVGEGYIAQIYARRASATLLKRLGVK